jgi:hypothetical protein
MGKYFTYSFYEKNLQRGELWLRSPEGVVQPAAETLSEVFLKYKNVEGYEDITDVLINSNNYTFYQELTSGADILRFDVIQDVLFVETKRGNFFDQIIYEEGKIKPVNQDNNFVTSLCARRLGFPDYWFDENNRKIYIVTNKMQSHASDLSGCLVEYVIEQFDMNSSILDVKLYFSLHFNFGTYNYYPSFPIMEPPKLTYNKSTKMFNVSHILRGPKKHFGLVSINVLKDQNLDVKQVNAFFPFGKIIDINYNIKTQKTLTVDSDIY